VTTTNKYIRLG